ncbi:MAG TPA: glycosyltransferase [Rhodanobacter sp.]|jgi:glycosyltransferase involved in cell wall biosynthesis|nr:glycosyltransferase [Rhodanobacter sp.]
MILLVHTSTSTGQLPLKLGRPEYSYRFVVNAFRPMLDELGIVIEVQNPEHEVDSIHASCQRHGEPCVFLCFMPPNKTPIDLACPTIPVFAWEYEALPDEAFGGKPRNDWRRVLTKLGAAITHSSYTVERVHAALGSHYPVDSIPAPLWDRMQALRGEPRETAATLKIDGLLIDSRRTDLSVYTMHGLKAALPAALPLPEGCRGPHDPVTLDGVLYTAIFNPGDGRKNWMDMVSAFCEALRDKANATLLLKLTHYDPDELIPEILEIIHKAGPLACRILLVHAYLEEAQYNALLQATTYAVNTSHGEGQCLPLMEYMSAGKPAVAPRHTSMRDYVDDECAFVIESSAELGTWPHDQRQAFRTLRQRIHYGSLVAAYRRSYHVAQHEPMTYRCMSQAARASLQRYCSVEVLRPRLERMVKRCTATRTDTARGCAAQDIHD